VIAPSSDPSGDPGSLTTVTSIVTVPGPPLPSPHPKPRIIRIIERIPEAVAEALRLLFNNPRELGLMAAVWALLYAPCYLGERRRSVRGLRSRRASIGGST
jgi:hypothetical protein